MHIGRCLTRHPRCFMLLRSGSADPWVRTRRGLRGALWDHLKTSNCAQRWLQRTCRKHVSGNVGVRHCLTWPIGYVLRSTDSDFHAVRSGPRCATWAYDCAPSPSLYKYARPPTIREHHSCLRRTSTSSFNPPPSAPLLRPGASWPACRAQHLVKAAPWTPLRASALVRAISSRAAPWVRPP
jgi:hypothetical protein